MVSIQFRHAFAAVSLIAVSLSTQFPALSQTVSGSILGQVQDPQGAVISSATVTARNVETGAIRSATSEGDGTFLISSVPAGSYEVSASANGFKTEIRSGVTVTVGGATTINYSLSVGSVTDRVEVSGDVAQVDTSNATMGGFVNAASIRTLPLNGRDWLQLALLQPGVNYNSGQSQASNNKTNRGNGLAISISGGRPTDNAFRIDGIIVNDYANAGPGSALGVNMGVDAIREFSVLTNNYSAEYGRGSGGVVNAITKSGTNELHGSAYYFHRNSALDARNFFDGKDVPPFRRHQFGGAVGGKIKTDKTFFFANYERLTEIKSLSYANDTLSANVRQGILCLNPPTCSQTNTIAIDPRVKPYLDLFPLPNGAVTGNTGVFAFGAARLGAEDYIIGKIDHYFSQLTSLGISYSYDKAAVTLPDDYNLKLADAPSKRQNAVVTLQHLFSPNVVHTTRVGLSRTFAGNNIDHSPNHPALTDPSLGFLPNRNLGAIVIPGISGAYGGIGAGLATNAAAIFGYTSPQVYDDLSWLKGRHNIRMGFSFERIRYNINAGNAPNGTWTFNSVQSFLEGRPSQFNADYPGTDTVGGGRMSVFGAYIHDDFRIRPNLMFNFGLRYEPATVFNEVNGKLSTLRTITDTQPTLGNDYYRNPTLKNFAPRIGYAYSPSRDGRTSIRGGFGMFDIVPLPHLFQSRITRSTPFFRSGFLNNPPAASFPNQVSSLLNTSALRVSFIEYEPPRSYKLQWTQSIQRQLTNTMALTVGYVGSSGVHLPRSIQDTDQVPPSLVTWNGTNYVFPVPAAGQAVQRVNPNFGQINRTEWSGHSSYHALQVNLTQRPIKGLSYQVAYTWSKSIDDGSIGFLETESINSVSIPWAFNPKLNRGVSDFDVPHNFVGNFLYEIPISSGMNSVSALRTVFGGWQLGGIYTRQTGAAFSVKLGSDRAFIGTSQGGGGGQRPNYVDIPGCSPNAVTGNVDSYIRMECFSFPAPGVLGNLGRNTLRMKTFRNFDLSLYKNQSLGERMRMQLRIETFNILNNTNLQPQTLTIFDSGGNVVSSALRPRGPTITSPRQMQLGLRLIF